MIEVGGDYFDFYIPRDKKRKDFGVLITDASGHGVPAAFITSMVKMSFHSSIVQQNITSPGRVLSEINTAIINKIAGNFVTAFYCYFNLEKMKMIASYGGHNPLFIMNRKTGEIKSLHPKGRVLGFMDNPEFEEVQLDINKDDRFFFYTDGLTEAVNQEGLEFEERLIELLKLKFYLEAKDFTNNIVEELKKHALTDKKESLDDDMAIIVVDLN